MLTKLTDVLAIVGLVVAGVTTADAQPVITTFAGGGPNGVPATTAHLASPAAVAVDTEGNLFIASREQHRVFRVDTSGVLTVVAGNGTDYGGGHPVGFSGDGGPATDASLDTPLAVAVDGAGNLFIADFGNRRIRKVNPAGVITTVAGNGTTGFSGDGGAATSASLGGPHGVAADSAGNLFIADGNMQRIRKVDTSGTITTVAGNGTAGFSGDGGPATNASLGSPAGVAVDEAGNLFIFDWGNQRIRKVDPSGIITTVAGGGRSYPGDGGPATSARLNFGFSGGVAVDKAGNLFIAESDRHRVRKVDPSGIITTVAGNGTSGFSGDGGPATSASLRGPRGVAVDGDGNLLIADAYNDRIRKVDPSGIITTVAGNSASGFSGDGGPAANARFDFPQGVAVDGAGNLFIADSQNQRIRKVDPSGIITTVAGGGVGTRGFTGDAGPATSARLWSPGGVAVDGAGNLFIADSNGQRVRKVDASGTITTVAGAGSGRPGFVGDGGPATEATLQFPRGLAVDGAGNLFIADTQNHRIRKVDSSGVITTVAGNGTSGFSGDGGPATEASLAAPGGVAVDSAGNLFIADHDNHRIRKVDAAGIISTVAGNGRARARTQTQGLGGDGGPATAANLDSPGGVTVDGAGNLFIAEGQRVRKVDPSGIISTVASGLRFPRAVVVDGAGNLFIAEGNIRILAERGRILKVDPSETITTVAGYAFDLVGDGGPATSARLVNPQAVAVDGAGNLFISDVGARGMQTGVAQRIRKVDASSIITTVAGNGTTDFSGDGGPATLASLGGPRGVAVDGTGNLFIADGRYHRVRKVDPSGIITTFAGNGTHGFSGDGGAATSASLGGPHGVAADSAGNLFIAEGQRVRKVDPSGIITTFAGNGTHGFSGDGGPATDASLGSVSAIAVDGAGNLFIADTRGPPFQRSRRRPAHAPRAAHPEGRHLGHHHHRCREWYRWL